MDHQILERIIRFNSKQEASLGLNQRIVSIIKENETQKKLSKILLSGGSTPLLTYEYLSQSDVNFSTTQFGLVDDRFVPINDIHSNEGCIREIFREIDNFKLYSMVGEAENYEQIIHDCDVSYQIFNDADLAILGMGNDGHFASLFPGDKNSEFGLLNGIPACLGTNAPSEPKRRITMNLAALLKVEHRILLIIGEDKLAKLEIAKAESTPISYIVNQLTAIYYAP